MVKILFFDKFLISIVDWEWFVNSHSSSEFQFFFLFFNEVPSNFHDKASGLVLENRFSGCCKNSGQNGHQQQNKHQNADKTNVAAKNKAAKGHIMR